MARSLTSNILTKVERKKTMALNTKALHISIKILLRVVIAGLLLPANMGFAMDHIVIGRAYNLRGELEYTLFAVQNYERHLVLFHLAIF